jgi:Kef-type K+ transport system membrane component KefB
MNEIAQTLLIIGALFLFGLATDALGRRTRLPRVTLLLLFGLLIGPSALNLIPGFTQSWFPVVSDMALVMVGFLLGEKLVISMVHKAGGIVLWISIAQVLMTALALVVGLVFLGVPLEIALVLGGIAPATDPAATLEVIRELKARGKFTSTLLAVVAIDDAWGLVVFSILFAAALSLNGQTGGEILLSGTWELGGAFLVGAAIGIPMAYLSGRVKPGEPTLMEALGGVFLCGGAALALGVSFLLAAMVMGAVVAWRAPHHERPFHAIENVEWPFLVLFFVLAGASLEIGSITQIGKIGVAYLGLRVAGKLAGVWLGARVSRAGPDFRNWMGFTMLPQAGVAIGMVLVAGHRLPEISEVVFPVVLGATILFELVGPVLTRAVLLRVGESELER